MNELQTAAENNTLNATKVVAKFTTTLTSKKAALEKVRSEIQTGHSSFQSSISTRIEKLQVGLAIENKIMDELALKTTRVKVLSSKLTNANNKISTLKSERAVMKSCV